ncbi:MAG: right-handed parallel beta-helix repeat-containing protein [Clostridia bacterium]|nr:right-handed parallel beta-helix repeat-containing protein [Clostridia bacterium]
MRIFLSSFTGGDDRERFAEALSYMKDNPGTTLIVEPGVYNLTTARAREAQRAVMAGEYGENPQKVMFTPDYEYDRGLDFKGHVNSTVEAYGATLLVDGFMEEISIRECSGVTVRGFTVDLKRKPYSKGVVTGFDGCRAVFEFADGITETMPSLRSAVYSREKGRLLPRNECGIGDFRYEGPHRATGVPSADGVLKEGDELYISHVFHGRPAVLMEEAENTLLEDITIHTHPGMGVTAFHATNVTVDRLRVVPSVGEHYSTTTDATHFASCRGLVRLDGCEFDGQGDDSINVHTYYYSVCGVEGRALTLEVRAPDGTHTQKTDCPQKGDRMELTEASSCAPFDTYRVEEAAIVGENKCRVTLDREPPRDLDGMLFADPDQVPRVEFVNCKARNHFARSVLIKSREALIENCEFSDVFELGVKVAAESGWAEGINSESVTVRNCRFYNNGRRYDICGGIAVYMDAEVKKRAHGTVVIEDNEIVCPECEHGIIVEDTKRAVLRRNRVVSRGEPIVVGEGVEAVTE